MDVIHGTGWVSGEESFRRVGSMSPATNSAAPLDRSRRA